jgi:hypothetical protein
MILPFFFLAELFLGNCGSGRDEEPSGEQAVLRHIRIRLATLSFEKISLACQDKFATSPNRRFQLHKRSQLFIGLYNETLSIAAMRVGNAILFALRNRRLRHSPNSIRPYLDCRRRSPSTSLNHFQFRHRMNFHTA